jgi:hypothetical protein
MAIQRKSYDYDPEIDAAQIVNAWALSRLRGGSGTASGARSMPDQGRTSNLKGIPDTTFQPPPFPALLSEPVSIL